MGDKEAREEKKRGRGRQAKNSLDGGDHRPDKEADGVRCLKGGQENSQEDEKLVSLPRGNKKTGGKKGNNSK